MAKSLLLVVLGLIGLTLGGQWIVNSAVKLALKFGMSQSLVGLTIVAVGTSLPELATSAVAARKRNAEIAEGNVVGSNIFNAFFVLGISAVVKPLPLHARSNIDVGVVILASLVLFVYMFTGKKRSLEQTRSLWAALVGEEEGPSCKPRYGMNQNNLDFLFVFSPSTQNTTAHTQNASIIVSHITLVLETRKAGVNTAASAANTGCEQNCFAR